MKEYDFYIIPTPIGNLKDITLQALEVLKTVDIIACEDSRVTQKLLNHYEINTSCFSYHKYNEKQRVDYVLNLLKEGKKIALVSDAGTPLICDPGSVVVKEIRNAGYSITALPGANAVVTFLSQISREDEEFSFIGFLPRTKTKIEEILNKYKNMDTVFYESPNRILQTLNYIKEIRPNSKVAFGRELTKTFEEIKVDDIENIITHLENNVVKGEFVCLLFREKETSDISQYQDKIVKLQKKGYSAKDISIILSELYDVSKNKIYDAIIK